MTGLPRGYQGGNTKFVEGLMLKNKSLVATRERERERV